MKKCSLEESKQSHAGANVEQIGFNQNEKGGKKGRKGKGKN